MISVNMRVIQRRKKNTEVPFCWVSFFLLQGATVLLFLSSFTDFDKLLGEIISVRLKHTNLSIQVAFAQERRDRYDYTKIHAL